jgi:cysteine desulfurase/selenocysteine lyase
MGKTSMVESIRTLLDVAAIRRDFPILHQEVKPGVPLVYLDNAASSQKPVAVIEALDTYYRTYHANVHRGIHKLSELATAAYEGARAKVARFINAGSDREIVFVRNATEAVNLVARTWGSANIGAGDAILLTEMEHHANLVPWQMLAKAKGAMLRYIPVTENGLLDLSDLDDLLDGVKLVGVSQMSNVLGTINPVAEIAARAHAAGALILVDAAQSVPHSAVDVQAIDVDFLVFSGHKMCAPTGIGGLYARRALLEAMPPFMGGGDMIKRVTLEGSEWNDPPWKFEAGTPAIAEAIGLGAAVDYLTGVGMDKIHAHEQAIVAYAIERLEEVPGVKVYGPEASKKGGVASFTLDGLHPHDLSQLLNESGVAVRAGHHCAQPLHMRYGISATARASFYLYNTFEEVDRLIEAIYEAKSVFTL